MNSFEQYIKKHNGILLYSDFLNFGLTKKEIHELIEYKIVERVKKGIYVHKDYFVDTLKINQLNNKYLIYSLETSAYLHQLTDRYPRRYSVTTISGYHLRGVEQFNVHYIKKDLYQLGIQEVKTDLGNIIFVYDKERTICDFVKHKNKIELQVYIEVIQNYFKGDIDLHKLSLYAKQLSISKQVMDIVALMMKP